jgi:hypothetical protein
MLAIPVNPRYFENLERRNGNRSGYLPCIVCGKGIQDGRVKHSAYVYWGSHLVTPEEHARLMVEDGGAGDMGLYAVGSDCLKKHPEILPYLAPPA